MLQGLLILLLPINAGKKSTVTLLDASLKLKAGRNILALQPLHWWLQAMPIRLLLVLP